MINIDDQTIANLKNAIQIASNLNWFELRQKFQNSDWLGLGVVSLEDAFEIAKPFVPQANVAEAVIKMLAGIVDGLPKSNSDKIDIKKIIQSILIAEGIDWKGVKDALMGNNPFLAGSLLIDDIAKLISPFVPLSAPVLKILDSLVFLGKNTTPMDAEMMVIIQKLKDGQELDPTEQKIYQQYIGEFK